MAQEGRDIRGQTVQIDILVTLSTGG